MKSGIIKKEFIDWLRLNHSIIDFNFESIDLKGGKNETIPKELTHDYLLRNFKIDEVIYKYYHLPTIKLISDGEFQRMKEGGFIGKKETALKPYSIKIFGAYHSRSDLTWKLTTVCNSKYTIKGNKIKYFIDLIPYFKEYAKGFEKGFNEFENTQIKPYFPMFAEKQDYVNKIFEFITKRLFINHNWASRNGFTINQEYEIVNAFDDGQHQGYFYRAWSTVFSNNNLFAPLFQEHLKALPPQQIDKQKSEQEAPKTFDEMFEYTELIDDCILTLKKVTPPILTNDNKFNLGSKSKGSITAWIRALKKKGIIKNNLGDNTIASLLNEKFRGLNLGKDGRTLRNLETTAYKKYYTNLLSLLPDLPLSTVGKNR